MRRAFVAVVTAGLLGVAGVASAAPALTGTLTVTPTDVSAGDVVTVAAAIDGRVPRGSQAEVAVACLDADNVMVVQGTVKPGGSFVADGARCWVTLRVVEMRKSGVTVLDSVSFPVAP